MTDDIQNSPTTIHAYAVSKLKTFRPGVAVVSVDNDFMGYITSVVNVQGNEVTFMVSGVHADGATDEVAFNSKDLVIVGTGSQ